MKKRTWEPLGTLEAAVMKVVWRKSPVTAREVCDRMTGREERAYTTIMTTMDRLHRKGLLEREKDGLAWRYTPALSQPAFEKALADGLAADILQSHGETALAAFVDATADVDESLLDRLAQLIAERRRGRR
ncbi:BlaI/MecI/CopY family transcriptional regulator [Myxococcus stipitatus]|uniref:BlaI/MecI/CopY family transcriptional regulator n=1 Tax=Myxococcus stipitatus TaxID=83455 RepID=UPI0030D10323